MLCSGHPPQGKVLEVQFSSLVLMAKLIELQREIDEITVTVGNFASTLKALLCL